MEEDNFGKNNLFMLQS